MGPGPCKTRVSIFETQAIFDAVTAVLDALHPDARTRTRALVEVSTLGVGTKAALMRRRPPGAWELEAIYSADHYTPGDVGVIVKGVW